jgi:hypothetical protein
LLHTDQCIILYHTVHIAIYRSLSHSHILYTLLQIDHCITFYHNVHISIYRSLYHTLTYCS